MALGLFSLPRLAAGGRGLWQWLVLVCAVLLASGYTTAFLYHFTETQRLPFRPVLWLAAFGVPLIISAVSSFPRLAGSQVLFLVFLLYRWIDAVAFGANETLADSNPTKDLGGAVVWSLCCLGILSEPRTLRPVLTSVAWITIVAVLLQLGYEMLNPGVFGHLSGSVEGRAAGWFGNANSPPLVLCAMLGLVLILAGRSKMAFAAVIMVGVGVFPTFSRGGMICYTIMTVLYLAYLLRASPGSAVTAVLMVVLIAGIIKVFISASLLNDSGGDQFRRAFLQGKIAEGVNSSDARFELAERAWSAVLRRPITGYGAGTAIAIYEPHNQALAVWLDNGIIGIIMYMGSVIALLWHVIRKDLLLAIAATPLWAYIPFTTSLIEDKGAILLMFVLPALASNPSRWGRQPSLKSSERSGTQSRAVLVPFEETKRLGSAEHRPVG